MILWGKMRSRLRKDRQLGGGSQPGKWDRNGTQGRVTPLPKTVFKRAGLRGVRRCQMVDTSLTGMRCRATKEIRSHQGLVRRYSEGIIQYNMDNLGRHLISVQWDNGVIDYVYPLEIEISGQGDEPAKLGSWESLLSL
jgi:hypothetical protein